MLINIKNEFFITTITMFAKLSHTDFFTDDYIEEYLREAQENPFTEHPEYCMNFNSLEELFYYIHKKPIAFIMPHVYRKCLCDILIPTDINTNILAEIIKHNCDKILSPETLLYITPTHTKYARRQIILHWRHRKDIIREYNNLCSDKHKIE